MSPRRDADFENPPSGFRNKESLSGECPLGPSQPPGFPLHAVQKMDLSEILNS